MRGSGLVACVVGLVLSLVHAHAKTPPFAPTDSGVTKVLKLVGWVGVIDDLSAATDTLPAAMGNSAPPHIDYFEKDGKQAKNWTDYLRNFPIWRGAKSTIDYAVFEADGPAGRRWRARVTFDLNTSEACIRMADMIARFGEPTNTNLLTDGGGLAYSWTLRPTPWRTSVHGWFGPDGQGCTPSLSLIEYR